MDSNVCKHMPGVSAVHITDRSGNGMEIIMLGAWYFTLCNDKRL